jgi:predicted dehydrogenase
MTHLVAKRILLIGLGRWGANHLRVLKSMPVELFVADHHEPVLSSSGVPEDHRSTDPGSFYSSVDAAVVVTPADTHFEICRELLEMKKDVFVEKPIALISSDAKALTILARKSGLILQVGHIFRFDPASLWLREAIGQGLFGRLKMVRARFSGFKRPRHDTGVTFADSIHFVDLFNFLLGATPRRVHAVLGDFLGRGIDDESLIVLEYEQQNTSPLLATIEAGYHVPGKFRDVTVVGSDSAAVCDYNVAQYKIKTFANRHVSERSAIKADEGAVHQLEFPPEEPLRAELSAFVNAIEQRTPSPVDGWAGFDAVRVVEAALESARTGTWIDMSDEFDGRDARLPPRQDASAPR